MLRKTGVFLALCILMARCCFAHEEQSSALQGGSSPNGFIEVVAVVLDKTPYKRAGIYYQLTDTARKKVILSIPSTYQSSSDGSDPKYWWDLAKSTSVFWNHDGSLAAVDEYPHQHGGQVYLIAMLGKKRASFILVPERLLLRATGFEWDRVRIRVSTEAAANWSNNHRLALTISGYPSRKTNEVKSAYSYGGTTFKAIIEVTENLNVRVVSLKPGTGA